MTQKELKSLIEEKILPQCWKVLWGKGKAYSGVESLNDCLGNFKRAAHLLKETPIKVCFIYLIKHFDAIASFVRGEYVDTEGIESRITDAINYLFLLYALKVEQDNEKLKRRSFDVKDKKVHSTK